jgi:hypothetical protein
MKDVLVSCSQVRSFLSLNLYFHFKNSDVRKNFTKGHLQFKSIFRVSSIRIQAPYLDSLPRETNDFRYSFDCLQSSG